MDKDITRFFRPPPKALRDATPPEEKQKTRFIPAIFDITEKKLPENVKQQIAAGLPVIDVPKGYIKKQKKKARAAQKAAHKAQKKAGIKTGSSSGKPHSGSFMNADRQSMSGIFLMRETRPQSGLKGFIPLIVMAILVALILAHEYGVF